jgi:gamma-glutamyltranspeptidase/glutathione hydrolase
MHSSWNFEKTVVTARGGLVTAGKRLAAEAGVEMLRQGGNAIDAAVAASFAVGVVEPWMSGIGGSGAMVIHHAGTQLAIEFGIRAPLSARPDMFSFDENSSGPTEFGWAEIKDLENEIGHRAIGVPGLVAALCLAHQRFGRLPMAAVMEPAVHLAAAGFDMDWHSALLIGLRLEYLVRFPETASIFLRDGRFLPMPCVPPSPPDRIIQRDLAQTLQRIAQHGADDFYRGEIAAAITEHVLANGGLLTREDFGTYTPRVYEGGRRGSYRGLDVIGVPGAMGSSVLQGILNILEGHDVAALGRASVASLHLLAEACRRSYEDHFAYASAAVDAVVPWSGLASKEYGRAISATIDPDAATEASAAVDPWLFDSAVGAGSASHTTHVCTVDADHNAVALTQTLGAIFGSAVTVPGTGVMLNGMMFAFDPRPGHANSIAGGKPQAASYTPTVLLRDGELFGVLGAPGGRRIPTAIAQVVSNLLDHGMGIQDAIAAPRLHAESRVVEIDDRVDGEVVAGLVALGHDVVEEEKTVCSFNFANPGGIVLLEDGSLAGGTDPCMPGAAVGL